MKKLNGFLILIGALSIAVLALVIYSTGVFGNRENPEPSATPTAEVTNPRDKYVDYYEADPDATKEIAVIHVMEDFLDYENSDQIYTYGYQKAVREKINALVSSKRYTENEPLVIRNPFGTNSQSLYVYFETDEPCAVSYNVHVSDLDSYADDFGGNVVASKRHVNYEDGCEEDLNTSLIHEFSVCGIQPRMDNMITFKLVDQYGRIRVKRFYYNFEQGLVNGAEAVLSKKRETKTIIVDEKTLETATVNASEKELTDGLYCIFREENGYTPYMLAYDNDGYMRMEVPLVKSVARATYVKDGELYLFVSDTKFVKINSLGEVKKIYKTDEFVFGRDFCVDDDGNVVVIASKAGSSTAEDVVCIIDFEKDSVYQLFDMGDFLPGLKKKKNSRDWLRLSSIAYTGDHMVVLAAEETNTLIKMRRIYNGPKLMWLAGDNEYFEDLPSLKRMFLMNEGDFVFPSSLTEMDYEEYDKIRESRAYYWALDQNLDYEYEKKEEPFGYYTRLLADDEERTLRSIDERVVINGLTAKSKFVYADDNRILVRGNDSKFCEMDSDFNIICTFTFTPPVVEKTIDQLEYEEDNPPPDDTVNYVGITKIDPVSYLFTKEIIVYIDGEKIVTPGEGKNIE